MFVYMYTDKCRDIDAYAYRNISIYTHKHRHVCSCLSFGYVSKPKPNMSFQEHCAARPAPPLPPERSPDRPHSGWPRRKSDSVRSRLAPAWCPMLWRAPGLSGYKAVRPALTVAKCDRTRTSNARRWQLRAMVAMILLLDSSNQFE